MLKSDIEIDLLQFVPITHYSGNNISYWILKNIYLFKSEDL